MIQASLFFNAFAESEAHPSPHDPNISVIDTNLFLSRLSTICETHGFQYSWIHKSSGRFANGLAFYNGELVITQRDAQGNILDQITRAGSAESGQHNGNLGISGLSTVALQNAALRGLRMAEFLYEEEQAPPPPPQPQYQPPAPPAHPYAQQVQPPPSQPYQPASQPPPQGGAPQRYGNRPFTPRGQGGPPQGGNRGYAPRGPQVPWEQERLTRCPSGQWSNTPYAQLPIETLQKWGSGSQPNKYAVMELNFRMGSQGNQPPAQNAFQPGYNQGGYQQ